MKTKERGKRRGGRGRKKLRYKTKDKRVKNYSAVKRGRGGRG